MKKLNITFVTNRTIVNMIIINILINDKNINL